MLNSGAKNSFQKTALVTGGSSGIGLAIVEQLLGEGYRVAFFGRTRERVEAARKNLLGSYGSERVIAETLDLARSEQIAPFFEQSRERWGGFGVLVNNAGISPKQNGRRVPFHKIDPAEWDEVVSTNLTAAFRLTQLVLPGMLEADYGRIVFIGSIAARSTPMVAGAAYVASKAGLSGLMRSVVSEYSRNGVTANLIAPGNIATNMISELSDEETASLKSRAPSGRLGTAFDIAAAVGFICSAAGGYINGATLDINGGEFIAP